MPPSSSAMDWFVLCSVHNTHLPQEQPEAIARAHHSEGKMNGMTMHRLA